MIFGKPEYIPVGRLILREESEGNHSATGTDVYGCLRCGALVFDQQKHDLSHTTSVIGLGI